MDEVGNMVELQYESAPASCELRGRGNRKDWFPMLPDDTTPTTTVCSKCGSRFPATPEFFYREKTGKYGLRAQCKACVQERTSEYLKRPEVRERVRELARGRKEYQAAWRRANPEKLREYHLIWWAKNRDDILERQRQRRARIADWYHDYYVRNKEKYRAQERTRRAALRGSDGQHSAGDVAAQYQLQRGKCFWCGEKLNGSYHVDHVVPVVLGGQNGPENLVVSCPRCNLSKGGKHPMDFAGRMF